jgi:hypothetical protein
LAAGWVFREAEMDGLAAFSGAFLCAFGVRFVASMVSDAMRGAVSSAAAGTRAAAAPLARTGVGCGLAAGAGFAAGAGGGALSREDQTLPAAIATASVAAMPPTTSTPRRDL